MDALELVYPAMERVTFFRPSAWEDHFNLGHDDAEVFFCSSWEKVECPKWPDPVALAWWKVTSKGAADFPTRRPTHYRRFITFTAYLQHGNGSHPIALPCEKLATFFDASKMTVSRSIQWGIADGFLRPHKPASRNGGRAAEFYGTTVLDPRFGLKRKDIQPLFEYEQPVTAKAKVTR